jgi:N-acetylneuraminate synthase
MSYLDYKKRIEFGKAEYDQIDTYCKGVGVDWFASAWDLESQAFLEQYNGRYNKICSAMLTNLPLVEAVARERKYTFVSTGMSEMAEVDDAVAVFTEYDCPINIMHCNSSYPAQTEDLNLRVIETLRSRYPAADVGYSGHEFGLTPSYVAVALGATAIERHITLNRTLWGTDQMASVEVAGFAKMVRQIRSIESALGDGKKRVTESEVPIRAKLRGVA